jgi:WD40-like Beta Propeller Repeat
MSQRERVLMVMRGFSVGAILAFSLLSPLTSPSRAGGTPPLVPKVPKLTGTLFFHRYSSYDAWDATLWSLDLVSKKLTNLSENWRSVISPINAHPSPDGHYITFMGSPTSSRVKEWDVFLSHWDGAKWSNPIDLTGPNGKRDEDPKFSPDGTHIVYKEDGVLATMTVTGAKKSYLTSGKHDSSTPFYTPDGKGILFERDGNIFLLRNDITTKMVPPPGISSYYPIGVDSDRFLFTRVQASHYDGIYWGFYNGSKPQPLFFNSDQFDSSDPYPYQNGKRYIFLTSGDYRIIKGGYNLMIADLVKKETYDIDSIYGNVNSGLEELGPAWSASRYISR